MTDLIDRIRRPEYTGENRCWPCTVVNGTILAVLAGLLARRDRRTAAVAVTVLGSAAIVLRGYFVPYTPQFAPRLVAALPIDAFDHDDEPEETGSLSDSTGAPDGTDAADEPTGEEVLTELIEAGVVVPEGDDLRLDDDFRDDWHREMQTLRELELSEIEAIADELTPPSVETRTDQGWDRPILILDGGGMPSTLRRHIAVAELGGARALESTVESDAIRLAAGRPLRSLLEDCPLCDGELTISRASCCGDVTPVGMKPSEKLMCPVCDERFFVFEHAKH